MTEADNGPFSGESPDDRLLLAQGFLGIASITMLVMSAVITERRRAEEAVKAIAGTLQESLLPSHLPVIPGIETAVDFRAAGRRHLVGGDFYDLFPRDDESWAVIVGDVLGKGATAAATTGLARYTLRAAAVQESQPSRILRLLNDAILRQSPDQSCTVACGRIDLNSADGARVTLSVGGHPLPLVLRANGRVEQVGHPGTMLGVLPDPELADHTSDLAPGDALILYTDGLTDAYAPGRIVKRAGLVAALESCAGQSATEIASGLHEAALGGGGNAEPRDDVVLLVLRVPERRPQPRIRHSSGVGTVMPLADLELESIVGLPVAHLSGEIDRSNAAELGERVTAAIAEEGGGLVVDLSELAFIDSTGIHMLFELAAELKRQQQALRVVVPAGAHLGEILDTVGLEPGRPHRPHGRGGGGSADRGG